MAIRYDYKADYDRINGKMLSYEDRPVIGISGNFGPAGCELAEVYYKSIEAAGGIPFILPPTDEERVILPLLERIDGLMLSGGADVNPLWTGEDPVPALHGINAKRDRGELLMVQLAFDRQLPIFGICRGIQILAIALGGSVHQDIATSFPKQRIIKHSQDAPRYEATHLVEAESGSLIANLLGEHFAVNSFHHQAVNDAGPHLRITAWADDGIVEAVESTEKKPVFGVQWHPECFIGNNDDCMMPLFRKLVHEAYLHRRARTFHNDVSIVTLDSHCDTPMFFDQGVDFNSRDEKVLVDYHKMVEGYLDSCIMVAYLPQKERTPEGLAQATAKADEILTEIRRMVDDCEGAAIAITPDDLYINKRDDLKSIMLGIENGYAIGRNIDNVERYRRMGVCYMTLCHNGDNDICDSAKRSNQENGGLSDFGRDVVHEMNRVGMMVDLSHAAESSFHDAIEASSLPIVCSHASSRALCDHPRNLTDDQLRALAESGGVAQVTLYNGFLRLDEKSDIDDAMRHLMHMIDVAGINHVGIGTDFDGDGGIPGCNGANEIMNITKRLLSEGLCHDDLEKIWGLNFLRVMRQVQAAAEIDF